MRLLSYALLVGRALAFISRPSKRPLCSTISASVSATEEKLRISIHKMKTVMTPDFFGPAILKRFHSKLCKSVEVRPSQISGLGLFAKKAIKSGQIVSFYPAHALGVEDSEPFVSDQFEYFADHSSFQSPFLHCTDQPIFQRQSALGDDALLYLDVNPEVADQNPWVSHRINDGAKVKGNSETAVLEYYKESAKLKNCIHIPFGPSPVLATVACKKIKKGDELLTTYGGTYWVSEFAASDIITVTSRIQQAIQATANDLFGAMKGTQTFYRDELQGLQAEWDKL